MVFCYLNVTNVILQGVYVASVSSNGCLSIHDFETLYCTSGGDFLAVLEVFSIFCKFRIVFLYRIGYYNISEAANLKDATGREAEKVKPTVHVHTRHKLEAMRWNPNNQDEVLSALS